MTDNKANRVFLIVLDSVGIGALPDADSFGDSGANTLKSASCAEGFAVPNLAEIGLGLIDGVDCVPAAVRPIGAYGRMAEKSAGKDTTVGHFELAGLVTTRPLPTYPDGFPQKLMDDISAASGRKCICGLPYSGTEVIKDFGEEHIRTGALIVYTSADSVFQIAAHEDVVPLSELYEICEKARKILTDENAVGRVIARPFTGKYPDFVRTSGRHDYSLEPPGETLADVLSSSGYDVIGVGKIYDIFAGRGITESFPDKGNDECMSRLSELARVGFHGLCFANLVDFDMLYGHRRNISGYGAALCRFDSWLGEFMKSLGSGDVLIITADHGCDPGFTSSTDHTREYVPVLVYGDSILPVSLGTRSSFADLAETVCGLLGCSHTGFGESFAEIITENGE